MKNQDNTTEEHSVTEQGAGGNGFLEDKEGYEGGEESQQADLHGIGDGEFLGGEDDEPKQDGNEQHNEPEQEERLGEESEGVFDQQKNTPLPGDPSAQDMAENGHGEAGGRGTREQQQYGGKLGHKEDWNLAGALRYVLAQRSECS